MLPALAAWAVEPIPTKKAGPPSGPAFPPWRRLGAGLQASHRQSRLSTTEKSMFLVFFSVKNGFWPFFGRGAVSVYSE